MRMTLAARSIPAGVWLVGALVFLSVSESRADRIRLSGGGVIHGVVLPADPEKPDTVLVQTETGSKPIPFTRKQIASVIEEDDPLDEYYRRLDKIPPSAEAEYELGLWCEQNHMMGLAENHYERAVAQDKTFAPAQKKLGHVEFQGIWMTYDEMREAQGLVKYKGKWISREERERIAEKAEMSASQESWYRRLTILKRHLQQGTNEQRQQAEEQFDAIRDPAAIRPLVWLFGNEEEPLRVRVSHILGAIPGSEAQKALIEAILSERNLIVRQALLDDLAGRREDDTVRKLVARLGDADPDVIGRAAWALAGLRVVAAVPKLIPALVQIEQRVVLVPSSGTVAASGPSATFATQQSVPVLTGPVVGPGVVAFGATSVPLYSGVSLGYSSSAPAPPTRRIITIPHENPEVLAALEALTGQNFGYDIASWQRWVARGFRVRNAPVRRVPQP